MATKKASAVSSESRDDKKLESNWKKARNSFRRKDYAGAVVRVTTSAEIAANIYVRKFLKPYNLPAGFVDELLLSADGLDGKLRRLIKPAAEHLGTWNDVKPLARSIARLDKARNGIAHEGAFKGPKAARASFDQALQTIRALAPQEAAKLVPLGTPAPKVAKVATP
jgi:hypothetical protein